MISRFGIVLFFFLINTTSIFSQSSIDSFLKPSDSLNKQRRNGLVISEAVVATGALVALNQLWYADYPKSDFHFINDNDQWLQMDKVGHVYSSYHLGSFGAQALKWSGCDRKSQLIYGSTLGFVFLSAVEVFDGYSSEWGFSLGDFAANAGGTALYVSQELAWKEQRIVPKFSFHTTKYASARPEVLGSSVSEQLFKDYNGQTYWLSANIHSFFKNSKIPKWLNIAVGYGGEGIVTGSDDLVNPIFFPEQQRTRQFYLSFDADLTKIKTNSHILKTIFSVFNTIKIPAPTFEIRSLGDAKFHFLYF
ncbi:DUF2279 domain-containing protein [Flavobacterium sp.]|uniref:DUF2279 domain-containing protein n=1 Tax=Flavobacterium sp. TaxID=239 RepID=UPI000EE899C5|nr:DUF2279 domain-containing protein [Flavobacterium sp.]HCQ11827.1 DUF2279 domain-containing protein [Flavobacterium sp.]